MNERSETATFEYSSTVHINYEIRGAGTTTLLLLHGFGASLESWRDIRPLLEGKYRLILVDMKGFGLSSKPDDGAYSIFDQARIIIALINHLQLRNFVLIGHSYGGSVAMAAYLTGMSGKNANFVRALVLIGAPCYPQKLPFFINVLRTPLINRVSLNLLSSHSRAAFILKHIFFDTAKVNPERIERYAKYFDLPGSHNVMIESARQLLPKDPRLITARIHEITVPTLIIWGDRDPVIFLWQAHRLHGEINGSRLSVLQRCGHVPHEERPEETAAILTEFIQ